MNLGRGEILFEGVANFPALTGADGLMRVIDVPRLAVENDGIVEVSIKNGSNDASCGTLAVDVGHMRKFRAYPGERALDWASATGTAATDIFTSPKPHNLRVGDRVIFKVGGAGGDAGASLTVPYFVVNPTGLMTDYVFQVSATPGGGAVLNVDAAEEVFFRYLPSPTDAVAVAAAGAADNIFTTLVPHGLVVGDTLVVKAATGNLVAGTLYYVLATATLTTFTVAPNQGGTIFDPCPTVDLTGVAFYLAEEFVSLTSFSVAPSAAATYLVNTAGVVSKIVQGFAAAPNGGRICISPAAQDAAVAFAVFVQIRRG
jgi:hypothetical protein